MKSEATLAMIGCGASGVAFMNAFIKYCEQYSVKGIRILIFEPAAKPGVGLAYQEDLNSLLINRPAESMSVCFDQINNFFVWLKKNNYPTDENLSSPTYISRSIFGDYLHETFINLLKKSQKLGLFVDLIKQKVNTIHDGDNLKIVTDKNKTFFARQIILATGHNQPLDVYGLKNTPKYLHSPYPMCQTLRRIKSNETIGVIGNSLTAIDVALSLQLLNHASPITFFSRKCFKPRVRSLPAKQSLQFLTLKAIKNIKKNKKSVSLRDVLRLLRKDLKLHGFPWKFLFTESDENQSLLKALNDEIRKSSQARKWQSLLSATNPVIEDIWHSLSLSAQCAFIDHFERGWLSHRSPIPLTNARKLLTLVEDNQLMMISGLQKLTYDKATQKYIGLTPRGDDYLLDWVINATGPSRYLQPEDGLLYHLVQSGLAREHILGGIEVDFKTAAIINAKEEVNPRIRVLGQNTAGVYYYTSSLEMLAKKAASIAFDLVQILRNEDLNVQNQKLSITTTYCPSHSAQIID